MSPYHLTPPHPPTLCSAHTTSVTQVFLLKCLLKHVTFISEPLPMLFLHFEAFSPNILMPPSTPVALSSAQMTPYLEQHTPWPTSPLVPPSLLPPSSALFFFTELIMTGT